MSRVYFTDRDLGKRFPDILTAAGFTVERHHDLFPADGSDEQWLEHCGKNGRIALSHNQRAYSRYTPNELAAVVRHRVALLIVHGKVPLPNLAQNFGNYIPDGSRLCCGGWIIKNKKRALGPLSLVTSDVSD